MEEFNDNEVIDAIKKFLEYGEESYNPNNKNPNIRGHQGYFSGIGWAATCLRYHLKQLEEEQEEQNKKYDPDFGDNRICECGHSYYRHFDSYDNMAPIGCKYCACFHFKEKK